MKFFSGYKITFLLLLLTSFAYGQATITIEVRWDNWSSENRVTFRDPSDLQIGSSICNPTTCFDGSTDNSYNNIGNRETYTGVPYGTGYDIVLEDFSFTGWDGVSYVRVYQDGSLIVDDDLIDGFSKTVTFDIILDTVKVNTVITNRRITHRVKKN
jgi:hypothetical protein